MKICYISSSASIHSKRWVNFFATKGHEVHVIAAKFSGGFDENVKLHPLPRLFSNIWWLSKYLSLGLWPFSVRRLLKKIKPDLVHAHYVTMSGYLAAFSGFHPFVMTAWGSDILIDPQKSYFFRALTKYTLKKADLITCDAHHFVEELVKLSAPREIIELVIFGVDVEKFCPRGKDESLARELGILNSPTVISLRSLEPLYDLETLINAIPLVLKEFPEAKFVIAGDGTQREYLEKLASSFENSVIFLGLVSSNELPEYLALADVYVSTSLSDAGLASSTAEAMACELPVIVTDFGDNSKWVKDGSGGFVIPTKSPEMLAAKIVYIFKNGDVRDKFGRVNRLIIEERNNVKKEMGKMDALYSQLVTRKTNKN